MKSLALLRIVIVALIAAAILFPIELIKGKISERRVRAEQVVQQFASETSRPQVIAGPFLAASCEEAFVEERQVMRAGKAETVSESKTGKCPTVFFPPKVFKAAATMPVESRHRGIYPIRLYHADVQLAGEFEWPQPAVWHGINQRTWKRMYVVVAVS